MYTHIHTRMAYTGANRTYTDQEQCGVQCLPNGNFNTWRVKVGTEPAIFQLEVNLYTTAAQMRNEINHFLLIIEQTFFRSIL